MVLGAVTFLLFSVGVKGFFIPNRHRPLSLNVSVGSTSKLGLRNAPVEFCHTRNLSDNGISGLFMLPADEMPQEKGSARYPISIVDKVAGRKKRLKIGYQVSFVLYMIDSVLYLLRRGFQSQSLFYIFGGGTATISILLYILIGAASNDRLSSETYKRLNLTVIIFSVLQLPMPMYHWTEGVVSKVPAFVALVNAVKGYCFGVVGWDKSRNMSFMLTDLKDGIMASVQGSIALKQESIGYLIGTAFICVMTAVKVLDFVKVFMVPCGEGTSNTYMILSKLSSLGRLGVMASIMYTLKDAADRNRLSGTTFVQLNYLMMAAFLTMSFYLSPVGPTPMGVLAGGLSTFTLYNGVTGAQKKQ
ncbi:hypothetical protein IV203_031255 [Nitzschia inconspicua]|uniref:Uncharacterized protein n=1 Tax=Nitzschia inconspicua TaxID=303405 RepID=A0A9K3LUW4_9STRA|nr:hypothetical protein IV203_031255 [Nitzschia inconspicua]